MDEQLDMIEKAGQQALEKMSAEHRYVWGLSRKSTLQEVEKFVEGTKKVQDETTAIGHRLDKQIHDTGFNAALQAILTHIQEMKGKL